MSGRIARLSVLALAVAALAAYAADDKKEPKTDADKAGAFDKFKALAGEWVGKGGAADGKDPIDAKITYKVTSGGSTVVETIDPAGEHEMVTMITKDGDALALTHYCMLGNQPHMKADAKGDGDKVAFKFTGAGNLKSDKDMHMHEVTYTFVDKDTLKTEWVHFMDGKAGGTMVFELKRKK
jgi:hypothetical protein